MVIEYCLVTTTLPQSHRLAHSMRHYVHYIAYVERRRDRIDERDHTRACRPPSAACRGRGCDALRRRPALPRVHRACYDGRTRDFLEENATCLWGGYATQVFAPQTASSFIGFPNDSACQGRA